MSAFSRREYPEMLHQSDVWYFGKSIKFFLSEIIKKDCLQVNLLRVKEIVNYLWWCYAGSISSVCSAKLGVFTFGKVIYYFASPHTETWTRNGNGSKPIHHHF